MRRHRDKALRFLGAWKFNNTVGLPNSALLYDGIGQINHGVFACLHVYCLHGCMTSGVRKVYSALAALTSRPLIYSHSENMSHHQEPYLLT